MADRRVPPLRQAILTVFGVGHLPAGATLASALAVGAWLALAPLGHAATTLALLGAAALAAAAVLSTGRGQGDPREVVVDEFLGMSAALLFVPAGELGGALVLFVAFRALDIAKVPPFSWIDRWRTPLAVLLDDVAIGLCLGLAYTAVASWMPA